MQARRRTAAALHTFNPAEIPLSTAIGHSMRCCPMACLMISGMLAGTELASTIDRVVTAQ